MWIHKILFSALILFPVGLSLAGEQDYSSYPIPPKNQNTLFYIQRSKNTNAIVYEANVKGDGTIDADDPVNIFWIRYTSDSSHAPLTYIQNKYAYGLKTEPYAKDSSNEYILKFVSYGKRWIYLKRTMEGRYAALMFINGSLAELSRVFIKLGQGTFWFPTIEYIELTGNDYKTQQPVSERFVP